MSNRKNPKKKTVTLQHEDRPIVGVDDMVLLADARENGITDNLNKRLATQQIYTNIGDVLIVCNPYKWLSIYDEISMKKYMFHARLDCTPHIFSTAESAYRGMILEEEPQCIIISGESGAGKTETSKHIQTYIAAVSGGGSATENIKRIFLESNPVLESFGNAKTLRNNNSSRFGKYFELEFDRYGNPTGGYISNYLLEKSRICKPNDGERNFHIFYQIFASKYASDLQLSSVKDFVYLSCSSCQNIEGLSEKDEFEITINAMKSVGMESKNIKSIFNLVAAVLHLGNIQFSDELINGTDGAVIKKKESLHIACKCLEIDPDVLQHVFTYRELQTMSPGGVMDVYQVPQNTAQAVARKDAVGKAIYERLFNTIVHQINRALDPSLPVFPNHSTVNQKNKPANNDNTTLSIGILDIYGFEVFEMNGFEQLCINYVNEKLQQIFIELTLYAEQEEYERQGIAWTPIPFFNNQIVCDLLDGLRPSGVFRLLDDTGKTLHGTVKGLDVDRKFLESVSQIFSNHAHFLVNNRSFTIKHYAGSVAYSIGNFAESNKDGLSKDVLLVLKSSSNQLIQQLFSSEEIPIEPETTQSRKAERKPNSDVSSGKHHLTLTNSSGGIFQNSNVGRMGNILGCVCWIV